MVQAGDGEVFRVMQMVPPHQAGVHVVTDGRRIAMGRSDSLLVEISEPGREEITVLRVAGIRHPATADEIRAREEALVRADLGDEFDSSDPPPYLEYLPHRLPAFEDVLFSDWGDLWIGLSDFDLSRGRDWLVFAPDGELRGQVHTPPGLRLRAIRGESIVGFVLDDLDVPYVRRHPLIPDRSTRLRQDDP